MSESGTKTKERIASAALELFAEKGYSATSMKDIAAQVGIKVASIYSHYCAKEELLNTLLNEYFTLIKENTSSIEEITELIGTTDSKSILKKMFYVFPPELADRYTKLLKIIMHEQFREEKAMVFVRDIMFTHNENYVKEVLDKLVDSGNVKKVDTELYARIIVSLSVSSSIEVQFYGLENYQKSGKMSRTKAIDFLFDQIIL